MEGGWYNLQLEDGGVYHDETLTTLFVKEMVLLIRQECMYAQGIRAQAVHRNWGRRLLASGHKLMGSRRRMYE